MTKPSVAVLGAGIVGVSCALALQERGWAVSLIDTKAPGSETSYGNAGVISPTSMIPLNNPGLWRSLPGLIGNRSAALHIRAPYLARNIDWLIGFFAATKPATFATTRAALHGLIMRSRQQHQEWLEQAGVAGRLRKTGWLFLYRSEPAFTQGAAARLLYEEMGINTLALTGGELTDLEPALRPVFVKGLLVEDAWSVDNPGAVVKAYATLFVERGGRLLQTQVTGISRSTASTGWNTYLANGQMQATEHNVIALGPWSRRFMKEQLAIHIPLACERGYHKHFANAAGYALTRPLLDTQAGYVLSPMEHGLRLTSGVELAELDAPSNLRQLELAHKAASQAVHLGQAISEEVWRGSRPTLPDSRPMIGPCPHQPGLWMAFGNHHIGFSTGPGTGGLLADLMDGQTPTAQAAAFSPQRYLS